MRLRSTFQTSVRCGAAALLACLCLLGAAAAPAAAAVATSHKSGKAAQQKEASEKEEHSRSLTSVAQQAGEMGRTVATSVIGLALAIAAIVLAFRRDFKEAAAVLAIGLVCILLAMPQGEQLLKGTVKALVG